MTKEQTKNEDGDIRIDAVEEVVENEQVETEAVEAVEVAEGKRRSSAPVHWLVIALRLFTGVVFIFSGFVKAIDPWGGFYKFQEYFQALGLDGLIGSSMFCAFAIGIVEMMLGVALFVGAYRRGAPLLALALMAVMLPLTLYLALTDAVPDCGCFGDALPLSNWMTFLKNIVIAAALVLLLMNNRKVPCLYGPAVQWILMLLTFIFGLAVALLGYFYQPLIDFRPFKVGTKLNVMAAQGTGDDDYVFIYKKDGVEKEFTMDSLPDEEDGWEYVDRKSTKPELTPAQRFAGQSISVLDEGDDVTAQVLDPEKRQLLFLFPDLPNVSISYTFAINELNDFARVQDVDVYGLTSGTNQQMDEWNDISLASYPMYMVDDSDLKMLARGNPAVVFVDHGEVKWKRTLSSINPRVTEQPDLTVDHLSDDFKPRVLLNTLIVLYLISIVVLFLINRGYRAIAFFLPRKDNKAKLDEKDEVVVAEDDSQEEAQATE